MTQQSDSSLPSGGFWLTGNLKKIPGMDKIESGLLLDIPEVRFTSENNVSSISVGYAVGTHSSLCMCVNVFELNRGNCTMKRSECSTSIQICGALLANQCSLMYAITCVCRVMVCMSAFVWVI